MNRRSFLIGTGSIFSTAFVDKANWFVRNQNAVMPFFKNSEPAQKLYFVKEAEDCYEIKLGTPEYGFPGLTYRDWLATYEGFELSKGKFINPRDLERLWEDYGMEPDDLDLVAAMENYHDQWAVIDSPFARAHEYLSKMDLFRKDNEKGLKIGDLDFVAPGGPGYSDNCGVFSEDPITASLLQARLIELGHNTSVEIVGGA